MADRIGHGPNCAYCSSTRGPASCPALPPPRPRIASPEHAATHPLRLVVIRDTDAEGWPEWTVYLGTQDISTHATHAEAITEAQRIARKDTT